MSEHHHVQQLERVSPTPPNQHQQQMHAHHLQQLEQLERHFEENNDLDENEEVRIQFFYFKVKNIFFIKINRDLKNIIVWPKWILINKALMW